MLKLRDASRSPVNSIAVNRASTAFVVAQEDGSVTVYSMPEDKPEANPSAHAACHSTAAVKAVWSPDGRQIVSGGSDGEICVWNSYL